MNTNVLLLLSAIAAVGAVGIIAGVSPADAAPQRLAPGQLGCNPGQTLCGPPGQSQSTNPGQCQKFAQEPIAGSQSKEQAHATCHTTS